MKLIVEKTLYSQLTQTQTKPYPSKNLDNGLVLMLSIELNPDCLFILMNTSLYWEIKYGES